MQTGQGDSKDGILVVEVGRWEREVGKTERRVLWALLARGSLAPT
jgi:hypothetical protein